MRFEGKLNLTSIFSSLIKMYDEIEIEDMEWNPNEKIFYYPCPCGDRFRITLDELEDGEEIANCPSCSLQILVVYEFSNLDLYKN